jgi:hypothetical protein
MNHTLTENLKTNLDNENPANPPSAKSLRITNVAEEWRPVPGYGAAYVVSNWGRVRSLDRVTPDGRLIRGYLRKPGRPKPGSYLHLDLWKENVAYTVYVHRLVLEAFVGPCPPGMEACHNNGIRDDNRLENLRWDTRVNNHADKHKHGTYEKLRLARRAAVLP